MKLFKKNVKPSGIDGQMESVKGAEVKVLGSGCAKCNALATNTKQALQQLHLSTDIEKVTDMVEIASYGVMSTPALVYKGKVIISGKVASVDELKQLLSK